MTSIINPETFTADVAQNDHGYWIDGTVEVTLRGETKRVKAFRKGEAGEVTAFGMTGRYETGTKAWPARVTRVIDPRTNRPWDRVEFGRDERQGRCRKVVGMVWFAK